MSTLAKVLIWILVVIVVLGAVAAFVMFGPPKFAEETAKPEFCARCHTMKDEYATFKQSVHGDQLESCNDCHLPNETWLGHYFWDGVVGIRDLVKWNLGMIPEFEEAKPRSIVWLDANCRRCHAEVITNVHPPEGRQCWECHRSVTHAIPGRTDLELRQRVWEKER